MTIMPWQESLELGIAAIDHEHRGIVKVMNLLHDAYECNAPADEILAGLEKLQMITKAHFAHEETFFSALNYKDADKHKIIHEQLLTKLSAYVDDAKRQRKVDPALFDFLRYWLRAHILGIDKKYAEVSSHQAA
jgi:hemerythrin-like metal-binding protein